MITTITVIATCIAAVLSAIAAAVKLHYWRHKD